MIPVFPAFTIIGEKLGIIEADNIWEVATPDINRVWDVINTYGGHAAFKNKNENDVFIQFNDSQSEVAFRLRFGL